MQKEVLKVAVVQATPVLFQLEATIEKVSQLVGEAKSRGAELVLFSGSISVCLSSRY